MICPCLNTEHIGICSGTTAPHIPSIERMERYCFRDGFVSCAIFHQQLGLPGATEGAPELDTETAHATVLSSKRAGVSRSRRTKPGSPQERPRKGCTPRFSGNLGRKSVRLALTLSAVLTGLL